MPLDTSAPTFSEIAAANAGKFSANSGYFKSEFELHASPEKIDARKRVFDHFSSHFSPSDALRILTLPGSSWAVENRLLLNFPRTRFLAFENNRSIFLKSVARMPRIPGAALCKPLPTRNGIHNWNGLRTNRSFLVQMDVNKFLQMTRHDFESSEDYAKFKHFAQKINCGWLDYTSQLHPGMERALSKLPRILMSGRKTIPFGVTFMKGREVTQTSQMVKAFGGRVEYLNFILNNIPGWSFQIAQEWEYSTDEHPVPMINILGAFHRDEK